MRKILGARVNEPLVLLAIVSYVGVVEDVRAGGTAAAIHPGFLGIADNIQAGHLRFAIRVSLTLTMLTLGLRSGQCWGMA